MGQHYTPMRNLTLAERRRVVERRRGGLLAVRLREVLRSLPIALGAMTLETQRVRTIRSNRAAILKARLSLAAAPAGAANGSRLVGSRR
jgi:hypothetical protein